MGSVTINGYVMAGGASTRFGFDKARAELNGEAMLARMCKSVKEVTGSVGIVAPFERYAEFGERLVEDHWPGQGPLGGIISALIDAHTRHDEPAWCLIVGCDMPFLTREWLTYLKDRTVTTRAAVVAPQSARGLEPLCACWHTSATDKRSEEHTSELQSRLHLVCRLLLEKKKLSKHTCYLVDHGE